jgi:hypothetical protein
MFIIAILSCTTVLSAQKRMKNYYSRGDAELGHKKLN